MGIVGELKVGDIISNSNGKDYEILDIFTHRSESVCVLQRTENEEERMSFHSMHTIDYVKKCFFSPKSHGPIPEEEWDFLSTFRLGDIVYNNNGDPHEILSYLIRSDVYILRYTTEKGTTFTFEVKGKFIAQDYSKDIKDFKYFDSDGSELQALKRAKENLVKKIEELQGE